SAVVGSAELLDRYVLRRFKHTVPYFFRGLDVRVARSNHSDEDSLIRLQVFIYGFQDLTAVPLARQRYVETVHIQGKQAGQQLCVIDIRAVRGIEIIPGAGVDPDAPALFWREPRQREIVQLNEAVKEMPGGIDLHGQPSFGEVNLNLMCALFQAPAYLDFMLVQQIVYELLPRIVPNPLSWVQQTQGRRRYHCLLDGHVRVAHGDIQEGVGVPPVTKDRKSTRLNSSHRCI